MKISDQLGNGFGEEMVVSAGGSGGGRGGAEVEVGEHLAVGERPQEQLFRELLLPHPHRRGRRCKEDQEREE